MAGYIGTTPVPQATQHRESFTATGGQTSFATAGYTPQFIDVYLNGVKLAPADYTATNGSDVVLASGATASDILEIVAYTPFEVANQTFTGTTTAANLTVTGAFTSQGIDDNADAVAITIDSSENVGIGTSSPTTKLQSKSGSISTPTNNVGLIANASASFVVDHGNDYGIYTGYVNSTNDAVGIAATRTLGGALPLSLQPFGGNVGIGTSSPSQQLTLANSSSSKIQIKGHSASNGFFLGMDSATAVQLWNAENGFMRFATNDSERMRIDASGNLLVGKTSSNSDVVGVEAAQDGHVYVTVNNTLPLYINRQSGDEMLRFASNGATVGSIGTIGNDLTVGNDDAGLRFYNGINAITPFNLTTNADLDDATDLGTNNIRFQDLYLSGGVYLGGTGSANKLEDYEEGSYTVGFHDSDSGGNSSSTTTTGTYTKIGRVVTIQFNVNNLSSSGLTGSSSIYFDLPFAVDQEYGVGSVLPDTFNISTGRTGMVSRTSSTSSSRGLFRAYGDNVTDVAVVWNGVNDGVTDFFVSLSYVTTT